LHWFKPLQSRNTFVIVTTCVINLVLCNVFCCLWLIGTRRAHHLTYGSLLCSVVISTSTVGRMSSMFMSMFMSSRLMMMMRVFMMNWNGNCCWSISNYFWSIMSDTVSVGSVTWLSVTVWSSSMTTSVTTVSNVSCGVNWTCSYSFD